MVFPFINLPMTQEAFVHNVGRRSQVALNMRTDFWSTLSTYRSITERFPYRALELYF